MGNCYAPCEDLLNNKGSTFRLEDLESFDSKNEPFKSPRNSQRENYAINSPKSFENNPNILSPSILKENKKTNSSGEKQTLNCKLSKITKFILQEINEARRNVSKFSLKMENLINKKNLSSFYYAQVKNFLKNLKEEKKIFKEISFHKDLVYSFPYEESFNYEEILLKMKKKFEENFEIKNFFYNSFKAKESTLEEDFLKFFLNEELLKMLFDIFDEKIKFMGLNVIHNDFYYEYILIFSS